jgi:cobalt-zinc-cadmium resistance protein CzcA
MFALVGVLFAMYFTGINFSISEGVEFIALFGVATQYRVVLVNKFRHDLKEGVKLRLHLVLLTALISSLGLLHATLSEGIG